MEEIIDNLENNLLEARDTENGSAVIGGVTWHYVINEDLTTITITSAENSVDNITIPSEIDGYSVTSIGNNAFANCINLTSITIPDGVTNIGIRAFTGCSGLTSITIPDSVTNIQTSAFRDCSSLESITIPESVTRLGNNVFSNCHNLASVTVLGNITTDWYDFISRPFYSCSNISTLILGEKMTKIGNYMFSSCRGLINVSIPDSVTSIGNNAFSGCSGLTSITIPDNVTSIGNSAFSSCSGLENVTIGDSVTSIGNSAFSNCTNLTSVTIPDSVTGVGDEAFSHCTNLKSVTIGNGVKNIGNYVFSTCDNLVNVALGNNVTSIGEYIFLNCYNLPNITIPDSTTSIGDGAFFGCSSLTNITLGRGITSIGSNAFYNYDSLNTIYYYRKILESTKIAKQRIYNLLENCGRDRDELEYICLNPGDDSNFYKKNSNDFSFVDTVADLAVNREFVAGYLDMKSGVSNEDTIVWETLSAIGNDVSQVLYENVLNYIQDVADINTCAVKAVCSISKMVGIENYAVVDELSKIPQGILKLLDIFSIKREYLLNRGVLNLISKQLFENATRANIEAGIYGQELLSTLSRISAESAATLDDTILNVAAKETWNDVVSTAFATELCAKLFANYGNSTDDKIYANLSVGIKSSDATWEKFSDSFLDDPYRTEVNSLKIDLNVDKSFNPFVEATNAYFSGKDFESTSGNEKTLVDKVLECRTRQKYIRKSSTEGQYVTNYPESKYSWYKEREYYDYLYFLHNQMLPGTANAKTNLSKYEFDATYNVISTSISASSRDNQIEFEPNSNEINNAAQLLTRIAFAIADIREQVKTQAQKNHMRGTFVLISYLINQYLTKNIPLQYPVLSGIKDTIGPFKQDDLNKTNDIPIQLQEYEDNTEYYNLSTSTTAAAGQRGVNARFWETEDETAGIVFSEIDEFYRDTLNLKHSLSGDKNPRDFLDIVYDIGADVGHLDKENSRVVIPGLLADPDSLTYVENHLEKSEEWYLISALQRNLYLSYTGNPIGFAPEMNFKNTTHASYQIHPYLWKFTEYDGLKSSIENAYYNSINEDMIKILVSPEISTHIGNYGNNINIWKDNFFDFTGYKSRYENGWHSETNGLLEHYDGLWYPDAVDDYMSALAVADISGFRATLYSVFNRVTSEDLYQIFTKTPYISADGLSVCGKEVFGNDIELSALFPDELNWTNEYRTAQLCLDIAYDNFDPNDDGSSADFIDECEKRLAEVKANRPETFFGKWYKTSISKNEAEYITNQLSVYSNDIEKIYNGNYNYNIYKYGIDKYGNSLILLKVYDLTSDYVTKQNTAGNLWIRKNAHPIAFPAFDNYEDAYLSTSWPQVRRKDINGNLLDYLLSGKHSDSVSELVYDFNITNSYKYITIAVKRSEINDYGDSDVFFVEPHEDNSEFDNETYEYKYSYTLKSYNELNAEFDKVSLSDLNKTTEDDTITKFSGFFNTESDILTIFSKSKVLEKSADLVENIGPMAFANCNSLNLKNIICDATENIEDKAFENCLAIVSVVIPKNVTYIGNCAFLNCENLASISVDPENNFYASKEGVLYTKDLNTIIDYPDNKTGTSYSISRNITSISTAAFANCNNLSEINVNSDNRQYCSDDGVLYSNDKTQLIAFPKGKENTDYAILNETRIIGEYSFYKCKNLSNVVINNGTTNIESYSFAYTNLVSVNIPDSVKTVKNYAFYNCDSLKYLSIGNGVTNIDVSAFCNCNNVKSIKIPQYVCSNSLEELFPDFYDKILSVIVSENTNNIKTNTFRNCDKLETLVLANNISDIETNAFSSCTNLTAVYISDLATWCNINFGNQDSNPLHYAHHLYLNGEEVVELTIPAGVTSIKNYAFSNCSCFTNITIPNSVTSFGSSIFQYCTSLTNVIIPNNITNIAGGTFRECTNLTGVMIPSSVTSIGNSAFSGCSNLTDITIPSNVTSIGMRAFYKCTSLTNAIIPDGVTNILHSTFYGCSSLTNVTIGSGVVSIAAYAFSGCTNLTSIVIPDNVTNIGGNAFSGCSRLQSINIGTNRIVAISKTSGSQSFSDCTNVTTIKYTLAEGESESDAETALINMFTDTGLEINNITFERV